MAHKEHKISYGLVATPTAVWIFSISQPVVRKLVPEDFHGHLESEHDLASQ